ncbi:MAG TPA: hypothetical protein IAB70_05570 [Candidatus Merdicola faecigallinarum]|uniref:Uncharacterized protein n=1 Tax=Candidatus Merdicola faecigallinarum TaxID=2840862 RepID=A0A9D1M1R2_9FIRM|nr:hypothetical protein [Candidatus Merdicola faecigallinarum]
MKQNENVLKSVFLYHTLIIISLIIATSIVILAILGYSVSGTVDPSNQSAELDICQEQNMLE